MHGIARSGGEGRRGDTRVAMEEKDGAESGGDGQVYRR